MNCQTLIINAGEIAKNWNKKYDEIVTIPCENGADRGLCVDSFFSLNLPKFAEYKNIICEVTTYVIGWKASSQIRFYIKKENGKRGRLSKSNAEKILND